MREGGTTVAAVDWVDLQRQDPVARIAWELELLVQLLMELLLESIQKTVAIPANAPKCPRRFVVAICK